MAIKWKKKVEDSINEHFPYGLRSATSTNLQVPRPKSEYFKRTVLYSGTNLCNSLPFNIKSLNSEICFKTKVKYYLLRFKLRMPNFQDLLCVNICIWVNIRIWQKHFFLVKMDSLLFHIIILLIYQQLYSNRTTFALVYCETRLN